MPPLLPQLSLVLLASLFAASAAKSHWQAVDGGPNTRCSDGSPYKFFYSEGTENSVVFEFEGGGCCFDRLSCLTPMYKKTVAPVFENGYLDVRGGIGSFDDSRNPVQNWTRVFVPYCTGDAHTGNNTPAYGVHHNGFVNAWAALDYAFDRVAAPERVFVTGISAGAVATYVLAPWIFAQYPEARQVHLADSYAPVFGKRGYNGGLANWHMGAAYDTADVGGVNFSAPWHALTAAGNTDATARAFPNATFASYVSAEDSVEEGFYVAEGGGVDGWSWTKAMRAALDAITAPNFARFVAPGSEHGVVDSDALFSKKSRGPDGADVVLGDWLRDVLDGKSVPMRVDCHDAEHGCR